MLLDYRIMDISIPNQNQPICLQKYKFVFVNSSGVLNYSTVCSIPSNLSLKRVWNFMISGKLLKNKNKFFLIEGDFSEVKDFGYNITLDQPLQGIFTINNLILDANKYVSFTYDKSTKKLQLKI